MTYIGAAAFAGIKIYNAANKQRFEARQEFAELTDFAVRAGTLGFFTGEYIEDMKARLDMSKAIDAMIILGASDRAAFEKKSGLIAYRGDYPDFSGQRYLYGKPQTAPVRTDSGQNIRISALSPLVDFDVLFSILRLSFLAVLIAVTVAFATLVADVCIVQNAGRRGATPPVGGKDDENSADEQEEPPGTDAEDERAASLDDDYTDVEETGGTETEDDGTFGLDYDDTDVEEAAGAEAEDKVASGLDDDYADVEETGGAETEDERASGLDYDDSGVEETGGTETEGVSGEYEDVEEADCAEGGDIEMSGERSDSAEPPDGQEDGTVTYGGHAETAEAVIAEPYGLEMPDVYEKLEEAEDAEVPEEYEEVLELHDAKHGDEDTYDEYEEVEELSYEDASCEYEEIEELDGAEEALDKPLEKNASGTGLLAAASAMCENGRFDKTDEDADEKTEFRSVLQHELTKAETDGSDIAVLSVEGTDDGFSPGALTEQASEFFKSGSRFFEKKDGSGIYIIVPCINLDEIFAAAKKFHRRSATGLLTGISVRSDRIVDAENFLNEAEHALDKAREDSSLPIVAFKVDTEKYKEFIDSGGF
jgi:hypothetical protein